MIKKLMFVTLIGVGIGILSWLLIGNISAIPLATDLGNKLQPIISFAEENWLKLVGTIGGVGTFIGFLLNRIKSQTIETKTRETESLQLAYDSVQLHNQQLNEKIETLQQGTPEQVSALTTQLNEAQDTIKSKEAEITRLTTRVNEAEHLANVVMHPKESDLIKRLEQSGYTITKTVA